MCMNITSFAEEVGIDYESVIEDYCGDTAALRGDIEAFLPSCHLDELEKAIEVLCVCLRMAALEKLGV